jgi:hypothetical protein
VCSTTQRPVEARALLAFLKVDLQPTRIGVSHAFNVAPQQ